MNAERELPTIIQAGMGVGVSNYVLARAVAGLGHLGVVSGTAIGTVMARRLQQGGAAAEETISALKEFPNQDIANWIMDKFSPDKRPADGKYIRCQVPMFHKDSGNVLRLTNRKNRLTASDVEKIEVAASFVEVTLAKRGHDNPVGINYLHKVQWPILPALYGAMLAGVDAVLIGAGLPKDIARVLDAFAKAESVSVPIEVAGDEKYSIEFDPERIGVGNVGLARPAFLGIVSTNLAVRALPFADGYVVENHEGGGHNANPRKGELDATGQPVYGPKDEANFGSLTTMLDKRDKGQRFWIAGNYADRLGDALSEGAVGIQVGTPFAFCRESGFEDELKQAILHQIMNGTKVFTNARFSPTGFPFKILDVPGTLSDPNVYEERQRVCNLRYLVELYESEEEGRIKTRCPAEPVTAYLKKGGDLEDTIGRGCLCNSLMSAVGVGFPGEPAIVTSGSGLEVVRALGFGYSAEDVVNFIEAA